MGQDDALTLLKEKALAVQTITAEVDDFRAACLYAVDVTKRQGGASIAAPGLTGKDLSQLKAACKTGGLKLLTKNLREDIGQISTGLTIADWGIAETATLVMDSTSEDFRIATMLCETHVAILPKSKIVPDAMSLENELSSALKAAPNILSATTYTPAGTVFATYSRDGSRDYDGGGPPGPTLAGVTEEHRFTANELILVRAIDFQGKRIGTVVIRVGSNPTKRPWSSVNGLKKS